MIQLPILVDVLDRESSRLQKSFQFPHRLGPNTVGTVQDELGRRSVLKRR